MAKRRRGLVLLRDRLVRIRWLRRLVLLAGLLFRAHELAIDLRIGPDRP